MSEEIQEAEVIEEAPKTQDKLLSFLNQIGEGLPESLGDKEFESGVLIVKDSAGVIHLSTTASISLIEFYGMIEIAKSTASAGSNA